MGIGVSSSPHIRVGEGYGCISIDSRYQRKVEPFLNERLYAGQVESGVVEVFYGMVPCLNAEFTDILSLLQEYVPEDQVQRLWCNPVSRKSFCAQKRKYRSDH